jgi:hypothetical protein
MPKTLYMHFCTCISEKKQPPSKKENNGDSGSFKKRKNNQNSTPNKKQHTSFKGPLQNNDECPIHGGHTCGQSVLTTQMAKAINQGVKTDIEATEEENLVMVVQLEVAKEAMEEEKIMPVVAVADNMVSKLLQKFLFQQHNTLRIRISREMPNNTIISIKLVRIPTGLGMPMIKRQQQVNKLLLK